MSVVFQIPPWVIVSKDLGTLSLAGFADSKKGKKRSIRHTKSHFLFPLERWQDLNPARSPKAYRQELKALQSELQASEREGQEHKILSQASLDYQRCACAHLQTDKLKALAPVLYREASGYISQRLLIVSESGLLGAFTFNANSEPSEMATAYRPKPVNSGKAPASKDFVAAAKKRLRRGEADTQALRQDARRNKR